MADGRVTIADVAAQAGVSVATVSKVINDRYGVAEQTSANVRKVIERLGYTSSLVAQSLRSRRSNIIGILTADIEAFNAELLKGAARAIRGIWLRPRRVLRLRPARRPGGLGAALRSRGVISALTDGTILVTPSSVDVTVSAPLVAVDHNLRLSRACRRVDSDNLSGAHHRDRVPHRPRPSPHRIPRRAPRSRVGTAPRAGLPPGARIGRHRLRPAVRSSSAGYQAGDGRAAQPATCWSPSERPTAIFAANDVSAIQTIAVAARPRADRSRRPLGHRLRQRARVRSLRAAVDDHRAVDPADGLRGGADPHPPHRQPPSQSPGAPHAADTARRAQLVSPALGRFRSVPHDRDHRSDSPRYRDPQRPVEDRVDDLLTRMTLEEKLAQLGSPWVFQLADGEGRADGRRPASCSATGSVRSRGSRGRAASVTARGGPARAIAIQRHLVERDQARHPRRSCTRRSAPA